MYIKLVKVKAFSLVYKRSKEFVCSVVKQKRWMVFWL